MKIASQVSSKPLRAVPAWTMRVRGRRVAGFVFLGVSVLSIVAAPPACAGSNENSPDRQGIEARMRLQTFLAVYFTWPASRSPNHHVAVVLARHGVARQGGCGGEAGARRSSLDHPKFR